MKVLIFGATGMVGQGVLRECLIADDVESVTAIGRTGLNQQHRKLQQIVHADLADFTAVEDRLRGFDACFYCLGVTSAGMSEAAYRRVTHDFTLAAATVLSRLNPHSVFTYVTGVGTDATEKGRVMWARVKGKTENDLQKLGLSGVYLFRPGPIQPLHGIRSRTPIYRLIYAVTAPVAPLLRAMFPNSIVTTEEVGRAMLAVARQGEGRAVLEPKDIARLGATAAGR